MAAREYNPNDTVITFAGNLIDTGIVSATFSYDEDRYSTETGTDGDQTRVRNNNTGGTVEIVLQQTSPHNETLSDLYNAGTTGANGSGVGAFNMENLVSGDKVSSDAAWVQSAPDMAVAAELSERTWTIYVSNAVTDYRGAPEV